MFYEINTTLKKRKKEKEIHYSRIAGERDKLLIVGHK